MRNSKKKVNFKNIIISHINNNLKEYISVTVIFIIGIILGVIFINNIGENVQTEISDYINSFIDSIRGNNSIDKTKLLFTSIKQNILIGVCLWFVGSTVIGIPFVYGIVAFRGFCLGYAVSSAIAVLGNGKGILFSVSTVMFQNLLFIPAILALAVSGIKLYKSIVKDRDIENVKIEIYRHTLFSVFGIVLLIISSVFETFISTNLLEGCIKYI